MLILIKKIRFEDVDNVIIEIKYLDERTRRVFICKLAYKRFNLNDSNQDVAVIFFDIIFDLKLYAIIS